MTNFNDELHIVLVWRIETFVASSIRDWCCQSLQSVWSKNTFLAGLVVKDTLSIKYIDLPATSTRLLQERKRMLVILEALTVRCRRVQMNKWRRDARIHSLSWTETVRDVQLELQARIFFLFWRKNLAWRSRDIEYVVILNRFFFVLPFKQDSFPRELQARFFFLFSRKNLVCSTRIRGTLPDHPRQIRTWKERRQERRLVLFLLSNDSIKPIRSVHITRWNCMQSVMQDHSCLTAVSTSMRSKLNTFYTGMLEPFARPTIDLRNGQIELPFALFLVKNEFFSAW